MKRWWFLLLLAPSTCPAQQWWTGFRSTVEPTLKRQPGQLPAPQDGTDKGFHLIHMDHVQKLGDTVSGYGNVHATYQGYDIYTDKITGSRSTGVFALEGNSRLIGATETLTGDLIVVDFKNSTFGFDRGRATLKPERLQGQTTGDVYVKAESGAGSEFDFTTEKGSLTTCDLTPAHFELRYDTNRVIPGKRAELRGVSLEILGRTVLKLPMIVIPLNRNAPKYLPEFGQSPDEGYYAKFLISTPLKGQDYLDTHIDLMSKMGEGLGLDYNYTNRNMSGKLTAYTVTGGDKSRVFTAQHQQKVGSGTFSFNSTYQISDYLTAPSSSVSNTNATFQMPWKDGSSQLTYTQYSSDSAGFSSKNEVIAFGDDRTFGNLTSRLSVSKSKSESGTVGGDATKNESVDILYDASATFRSFTADLVYQRSVPVGPSQNFYSASDVTPMLTLKTSAQKILNSKSAELVPFDLEASVGELVNPSSLDSSKVTRVFFDLGFRRNEHSGDKISLDWGSRFRQGLYSDDTAQYMVNYDANLSYKYARDSSLALSYSYLRGFGYTPLAIDSIGRNDSLSLDLNYQASRSLTLSAQTGYDIYQSSLSEVPWQFLWMTAKWKPGDWLDLTTTASYDTFSAAWSNFRLDAGLNLGPTKLVLGARYDGLRSQWAGFNVLVDGFKTGKVSTNLLLDYNGYTKQFDSQHYQFIYDLHCAEAVLEILDNQVGFRSGRTVGLFIRIKAFPFGSNFGQGTRGQSLGGGAFGFGN